MNDLSKSVDILIGIQHPRDEEQTKTYILALHKYEDNLDADIVGSYLVRELHWANDRAKDVQQLITTLNSGKYFKGGDRKHFKKHYEKWKTECNN